MGCFSKFFLTALNFAVFAIGVAVVVLASLVLSHGHDFNTLIDKGSFTVPIILLVIGIIILLIGFFGCFGAIRESPCLLYTYASIVLVLLIGQIGIVVYGVYKKQDIQDVMAKSMTTVFESYGNKGEEAEKSLDAAQHSLHCCGVVDYKDWMNGKIRGAKLTGDVPIGCCKSKSAGCNDNLDGKSEEDVASRIYTKGCYTAFWDVVDNELVWLIVGAVVLALIQLTCVIIACGIGKRSAQMDRSAHMY